MKTGFKKLGHEIYLEQWEDAQSKIDEKKEQGE